MFFGRPGTLPLLDGFLSGVKKWSSTNSIYFGKNPSMASYQ
jgi:hypothetical protein